MTIDDRYDPYPEPPAHTTESQPSSPPDDQLQSSDPQEDEEL